MLKQLFNNIFNHVIYVQLWEDRLRIVDINTGREFDQPPFIAVEKNDKGLLIVKAIGKEAKGFASVAAMEVVNPFSHPRQLIRDFVKAEKVLQHAFQQITEQKMFATSPKVVIHPMEKLDGGLTQIEVTAFRELCIGAGAREVLVYVGEGLVKQNFNYAAIKGLDLFPK